MGGQSWVLFQARVWRWQASSSSCWFLAVCVRRVSLEHVLIVGAWWFYRLSSTHIRAPLLHTPQPSVATARWVCAIGRWFVPLGPNEFGASNSHHVIYV